MSVEVPGWWDTKRLERASIWSKERLTEGKSGLDKCAAIKFFDEANNQDKSAATSCVFTEQNFDVFHFQKYPEQNQ